MNDEKTFWEWLKKGAKKHLTDIPFFVKFYILITLTFVTVSFVNMFIMSQTIINKIMGVIIQTSLTTGMIIALLYLMYLNDKNGV